MEDVPRSTTTARPLVPRSPGARTAEVSTAVAPPPRPPSATAVIWRDHIQPWLTENWYLVAGVVMVVAGASLISVYFWDRSPVIKFTLMPALLAMLALVLISSLVQSGWVFRPAAVSPDLGRLSLSAGWGRFFSSSSLASGFFALAKCAWLAGGLYWAVAPLLAGRDAVSPQTLMGSPGVAGVRLGSEYLLSSAAVLVVGLIALGALDWFYRWWRLERELMMTKEELKEELARQETPEVIGRKRRGLAKRLVTAAAAGRGGVE